MATHKRRRVVLTGGPGAGKTAVLELIRRSFCSHIKVLPEAASIVFGGGFPREEDSECKRAAQRAIFYVERELEHAGDSHNPAIVLWEAHPRRFVVESKMEFLDKAAEALAILRAEMPECCRRHVIAGLSDRVQAADCTTDAA